MATTEVTVPFFKKKGKGRPTTTRRLSGSPGQPAVDSPKSEVVGVFKPGPSQQAHRTAATNLSAGTKRTASQRDSLDDNDAPEMDGPDVKWTAAGSHLHAALDIWLVTRQRH